MLLFLLDLKPDVSFVKCKGYRNMCLSATAGNRSFSFILLEMSHCVLCRTCAQSKDSVTLTSCFEVMLFIFLWILLNDFQCNDVHFPIFILSGRISYVYRHVYPHVTLRFRYTFQWWFSLDIAERYFNQCTLFWKECGFYFFRFMSCSYYIVIYTDLL